MSPSVRPVTVQVSGPELQVQVWPPLAGVVESAAVTVYPVIGLPPSKSGADQVTLALAWAPVAVPMVGTPGTVAGVTAFEGEEGGPVPTPLVAVTVKV